MKWRQHIHNIVSKPPAQYLDGRSVLVIESKLNYRTSLRQFLVNLKIDQIKFASSIEEAKKVLQFQKVGFVISEWELPGNSNGIQLCREVRQRVETRDIPFLLMSPDHERPDIVLASEVGIDGYLIKPFSFEAFCEKIGQIIKAKTLQSQLSVMIGMAETCILQKDLPHAEKILLDALQQYPDSARAYLVLGKIALTRNQHTVALKFFHSAVSKNPEYIEAHRWILKVYEHQRDVGKVESTCKILHGLSPDNPRYTLMLAQINLQKRNVRASAEYFKKTISLSPLIADAHKGLGNIHMMNKEFDKARKRFKKALDLDSNDISTLNYLGLSLVRLGKYSEGLKYYEVALRIDPKNHQVLFNIGQAKEKTNDLESARFYYAKALRACPNYDKALRGIERLKELAAQSKSHDQAAFAAASGQ